MRNFIEWLTEMSDGNVGGDNFFWGDNGSGGSTVAAGVLILAADTKRICLNHRSNYINNWIDGKSVDRSYGAGLHHLDDPEFNNMYMKGCWGTIGGALGGRNPLEAAKDEVEEEIGYGGPWLKIEKSMTWNIPVKGKNINYQNFLGLVPKEKSVMFKPSPGSSSGLSHAMESLGIDWATLDEIKGKNAFKGIRFHDGLTKLLSNPSVIAQIEKMLGLNNQDQDMPNSQPNQPSI
jgi:8-oxo-dGTP pyrophosphatase MutT (NUDIX family)